MNIQDDLKLDEYAQLDAKIKALTAQKDALRADIVTSMASQNIEKLETGLGKFTISYLKKWEYPSKVVQLGEDYKAAKAKSESTGEATYTEEGSLRFTPIKL